MASSSPEPSIQLVCVIGAGLMGSGIATVCAFHGYQVLLVDVDEASLTGAKRRISFGLAKMLKDMAKKEQPPGQSLGQLLGQVQFSTDLPNAVHNADLIVESIVENLQAKQHLFQQVQAHCRPDALLATNTSSLLVSQIGTSLEAPMRGRFAALHFFNPVPVMALVEVVPSAGMRPEVLEQFIGFVKSIGKVPLLCKDTPGFIANRILIPLMAESIGLVERCVATPEEVDQACQLGLGLPIGPFRLLDFVGLDTAKKIMDGLIQTCPEELPNLRQSKLLAQLVEDGKRGRKTGEGFYKYTSKL